MSHFYVAEIRVKQIDVIYDGDPSGSSRLFAILFCDDLQMEYRFSGTVNTGDQIKSSPILGRSLFTKVGASSRSAVKFGFGVTGDFVPSEEPRLVPSYVTATIDVNLEANNRETTWWIETHVNSAQGSKARIKISFDLTTYKPSSVRNNSLLLGYRDDYAQGPSVDLMSPGRKVDAYPAAGADGDNLIKGVWRTDYNQLGAVGNDQLSSLVAGSNTGVLVYLYEHAFNSPNFLSGMRRRIYLGGYGDRILNLRHMGLVMQWPPKPSMNNNVSCVEVALPEPSRVN